jgi:diguanylate cyclase (GGDEF)-like protein
MAESDAEWSSLMEASLLALLEAADEGVFVFDRHGRCRMIGRRAGELFGIDPAGYVGKPRTDVLRALARGADDPEVFLQMVGTEDLLEPPRVVAELDVVRPKPRRVVWTSFPVVRSASVVARLVLLRDVTRERSAERGAKQLQSRVEQLSPNDTLTGLLNQRRFREELEREHGRSSRAWDTYAVLRIDVDGMGDINDGFGVPVGDGVLEKVGECLNKSRREYDQLARLEADEFVALLPGADVVAAQAVADRFVNAVKVNDFGLTGRRVSVCVGCSVWKPPSGERGEDILRRAGIALFQARAAGKGQVHVDEGGGS